MPIQTEKEFKSHLKEQIEFLTRSALAYDEGFESEAKRLAVILRVLLYDKGRSVSLLSHLEKKDILFYDTASDLDPNNLTPEATLVIAKVQTGTGGERKYVAPLDEGPPSRYVKGRVPFDDWWDKEVIKDDQNRKLTRRDIVTLVCHKDGGAHIDKELDEIYFDLTRENSLGLKYFDDNTEEDIKGSELASIRQITHEVLKSFKDEFPEYSPTLDQYFHNLKSVFEV